MNKEEFFIKLQEIIDLNSDFLSDSVLIRTVLSRQQNKEFATFMGFCRLLSKEEANLPVKEDLIYEDIKLIEKKMNLTAFITFLQTLNENFDGNDFLAPLKNTIYYNHEFCSKKNDYSQYPGNLFSIKESRPQRNIQSDPTMNYNLPCFSNGYHATKAWLNLRIFHEQSDGRIGEFLFFIPEMRARIDNVKNSKRSLTISVSSALHTELDCQVIIEQNSEKQSYNKIFSGNSKINFKIKHIPPFKAYIQIITPSNELLDYLRFESKQETKNTLQLHEQIMNGENNMVEFKPYIVRGDPKMNEVIETTVAFLNSDGGTIFFGVSDKCGYDGIPKNLLKDFSPQKYLDNFEGYIKKLLSDKLNKAISIKFQRFAIADKNILSMKISKGLEPPYYMVQENKIFIRKGSTNRFPDPVTELPKLFSNSVIGTSTYFNL